ncbi:MAG TPA: chromosome segregation protein SMC [Dehalococcoidia bacterium]|nr:chromosome segregation protein SMC [Dehalococcoidia bacterium]
MTDSPVRLRRLEVQGFKSFATRTVFEFGAGVTAIVGPNGSGKSNLADAFRWVLGEQNPRGMRLRRLEDVIFAGGGKRAQAGYAEVSMVLDNSEGWLPLEFSEVVVTRRLHRSGESEYLLNRNRARLRDILDLFLRARLGQNSYAILGQGMVDLVLSLRPEERRALIEEAADVRRHRLKIEEAVDQLAATRDNRDRVELLLAEIGPRLEQLERQAQRASQHTALAQELAGKLHRLYSSRQQTTRVALETGRARHAEAVADTSRAAALLAAAETGLASAREEGQRVEVEFRGLERNWRELEDEQLTSERALRAVSQRLPELIARKAEVESDLEALEEELHSLAAEAPQSRSPTEALQQAEQEVKSAEAELRAIAGEAGDANRRVEAAEKALSAARDRHSASQDRILRLEVERERLVVEDARLAERRILALARLRDWAGDFAMARAAAGGTAQQLDATQGLLADARLRAQKAQAAYADAELAVAGLTERLDTAKRRAQSLESEQEARRPAEEVIVSLLDALRGGGPGRPRVLGILGGLIHVQRGYEIAVEVGLAEGINGLVVRTEREALGAVAVLQEIEAGRLNFFVLEGLRGGYALNLSGENGVLGVASRFVRCEDAYRDLVDLLLGRIIVVEDVETARRVVRRGLGSAVTLDGSLIRAGGMISGGRGKADGYVFQAGLELDDLHAEIATLEAELATENERLARLRDQAGETTARMHSVETASARLEQDIETSQRGLGARHRTLEPIRGELDWIHATRVESVARRAALEEEEAALPATPAKAAEQAARLQQQMRDAAGQLEEMRARQQRAEAAVFEARGRHAALLSERAALEALHHSRGEAEQRSQRRIAARRAALETHSAERDAAEADLQRLTAEVAERQAAVSNALARLSPARSLVGDLAERQRSGAEDLTSLRETFSSLERARLEAELQLARAEQDADRLRIELETEGLVFEATPPEPEELPGSADPGYAVELEGSIRNLRRRIRELGAVNEEATADYRESKERFDFLSAQVTDLREAETTLLEALEQLRQLVRERFRTTFQAVNADFQVYFRTFFGGGQARLALTEPEDYGESGVDIIAQPPGKRLQNLAMLSGGERSMTAVALLFALLESKPAPFCVLDEVDAALDEANVGRFSEALARLAGRSQFLVITHNRGTVQAADQIYGVSMTGDGVSNVLSMRLSEAAPLLA